VRCSIVLQALEQLGSVDDLPVIGGIEKENKTMVASVAVGKATSWLSKPTAEPQSNAQDIPVNRPLEGIVAVEIGHSVAAPFAGHVLGDLGATVIKIENPEGGRRRA